MAGANGNGHNGNGAHPNTNGLNGRNANGTFAHGNKGGPGNPYIRQVAAYRKLWLDASTPARVKELIEILWDKALEGQEQWAIIEIINRLYGKPKETIRVEPSDDPTDALELLSDQGVTDALDHAFAKRAQGDTLAEPGSPRD